MATGTLEADRGSQRLAALVDAYSRRVYPAVLEQHPGASVSSPLGVWLLLAACVSGARGANRAALEEALGCPADEAGELLHTFMASPPPALKAAIAVWVRASHAQPELAQWVRGLPAAVESGFMPAQQEADAWADRNTLGLIKTFPAELDETTTLVLASALATRVSWRAPFGVVPAAGHLGSASPWRGTVKRLLWDSRPRDIAIIAETQAAGLVAVHQAQAREDLTVISVSADPAVARDLVLEAAHEVAACARAGRAVPARSLFELPLGGGHSWQIKERKIRTWHPGERVERVSGVTLPAWQIKSALNLKLSALFGSAPALDTMGELISDPPRGTQAGQAAIASFTRYGFEAAAITTLVAASAAFRVPDQRGIERTAILRFDHPFASLAIAGGPAPPRSPDRRTEEGAAFTGLPLFAAWVNEPDEPEEVEEVEKVEW